MRGLSKSLLSHTWQSVHLVTPFDSGGSSASLRRAFGIIAVGDLRNRMLALADPDRPGFMAMAALLARRLPARATPERRTAVLAAIANGSSPEIPHLSPNVAAAAQADMTAFLAAMPPDFDLSAASVGNLLLVGAWLRAGRQMAVALERWSTLLAVRGVVRPVVEADLHLAFDLTNGEAVIGQHKMTGVSQPIPAAAVNSVRLVRSLDGDDPADVEVTPAVSELVRGADLICYPMGSFYSSVLANLLPNGVGTAIASAQCAKVFVPNTGHDPEQRGLTVGAATERLVATALSAAPDAAPSDVLDAVIIDQDNGAYPAGMDLHRVREMGIHIIDMPLVTRNSAPGLDADRLSSLLVRLARARLGARSMTA
ncbi:MAG: GAK system CofD-like protein [Myxococcales bacterium]|nr:GAK system CofD-like protein [Myxococcales bacterium]